MIKSNNKILPLLLIPLYAEANFNPELLEQFGIDPSIVEQLESGNVIQGENTFPVFINGEEKGVMTLNFLSNNDFYINEEVIDALNLVDNLSEDNENTFLKNYRDSKIVYENASINIYIENRFIKKDLKKYEQKGFGIFANYTLDYDKELSDEEVSISDSVIANVDVGANMNGYLYRGNFLYNNFNDEIISGYNYLQKNDIKTKRSYKIGDISTLSPHHPNIDLLGGQIASYNTSTSTAKARFTGTASGQTRLEVYISDNIKIYEKRVPSGYYEIDDLYVPLSVSEIRIVERSANGDFKERLEPVQSIAFNLSDELEYALSAGVANTKLFESLNGTIFEDEVDYDSWVVSGYSDIYKKGALNSQASLMLGEDYYFTGVNLIESDLPNNFFKSGNIETGVSYKDNVGYYVAGNLNGYYSNGYSLNLYSRYQNKNFRTLEADDLDLELQYSASFSFPAQVMDAVSISYGKSFYYDNDPVDTVGLVMTKVFSDDTYLSIEGVYDSNDEWTASAVLSIPVFSSKHHTGVDLSVFTSRDSTTYEASVNGDVNSYEYDISTSKERGGSSAASLALNKTYRNVYTSAGVYASEGGLENAYVSLEGGMAYSDGNYDLTSDSVDDTFGFVKIDDFDNVSIETPSGMVTTSNGVALMPYLTPNSYNEIIIDTKTLPKNATLLNGYQEVYTNDGDVVFLKMETQPFYSSLVRLIDKDGKPLDQNYVILSKDNEFVTTVGLDGIIFFEQKASDLIYKAKRDRKECFFDLSKLEKEKDSVIEFTKCE